LGLPLLTPAMALLLAGCVIELVKRLARAEDERIAAQPLAA
jgi:hypothetical protein